MPHRYRVEYSPPFPVLPVALFHPESGAGTGEIPALVDTGADATLVPARYLAAVQAEELYSTSVRSHWGESRLARIYLIDMEVAGLRLPGVEVVADDLGEDVLLGRNVSYIASSAARLARPCVSAGKTSGKGVQDVGEFGADRPASSARTDRRSGCTGGGGASTCLVRRSFSCRRGRPAWPTGLTARSTRMRSHPRR